MKAKNFVKTLEVIKIDLLVKLFENKKINYQNNIKVYSITKENWANI